MSMVDPIRHLFAYIENGTSPCHAVLWSREVLLRAGFQELKLRDQWKLEKGGKYFTVPFAATLYAFTVGEKGAEGPFRAAGAHVDTPVLRIKPAPELLRHGCLQLNTEVYGGPILNTWFDRPLSIAGQAAVKTAAGGVEVLPVDLKKPVAYLPNLAVHMNRGVNENGAPVDNQKELLPIVMMTGEKEAAGAFRALLGEAAGLDPDRILDWDLCLYNPASPALVGWKEEFISAPRLDDLTSCAALVHGLCQSGDGEGVNLVCLFDNEEIGSRSKQGADSALPRLILEKICHALGMDALTALSRASEGLMISVDVAHAYHPNYPQVQDITNFPVLGGGFVLKSASNQSYAWDCGALARAEALCQRRGIPFQRFAKHSNTKGGGTIGSILSSQLPVPTVDMGVGLLAMHSACEMMAAADQVSMERFAEAFFARD